MLIYTSVSQITLHTLTSHPMNIIMHTLSHFTLMRPRRLARKPLRDLTLLYDFEKFPLFAVLSMARANIKFVFLIFAVTVVRIGTYKPKLSWLFFEGIFNHVLFTCNVFYVCIKIWNLRHEGQMVREFRKSEI